MAWIVGGGVVFIVIVCAIVVKLSNLPSRKVHQAVAPEAVNSVDPENPQTTLEHQRGSVENVIQIEEQKAADSLGQVDCGPTEGRVDSQLFSGRSSQEASPLQDKRAISAIGNVHNSMDMPEKNELVSRDRKMRLQSAKPRTADTNKLLSATKEAVTTTGGGSVESSHAPSDTNVGQGLLPKIHAKRSFGGNTMIEDIPDFDDQTLVDNASPNRSKEQQKEEDLEEI